MHDRTTLSGLQRIVRSRDGRFGWLRRLLPTIGIVAVLAAVASMPLIVGLGTWAGHYSMKDEWNIAGPACPGPEHAWKWPQPRTIEYKGVRFSRQYGGIFCEAVPVENPLSSATYPVCQFTGPGRVIVETDGQTLVFEPAIGKPATVRVRDGRVSCVVGGWFGR